jgi:flagellar motor switch/type III secretory pathway protein FliN
MLPPVRTVSAYPWHSLPRVSRAFCRDISRARRALGEISLDALARAAAEMTASSVAIVPRRAGAGGPPSPDAISLQLGDSRVAVGLDPTLAVMALSRVLGRGVGIDGGQRLDPSLNGALAAVLVEVIRRAGSTEPVQVGEQKLSVPALRLEATVLFDEKPYATSVWVNPAEIREEEPRVSQLGELLVALPLVVAFSLADPHELASLARGDAWLPGSWLMDARGTGRAILASPGHEHGRGVDLAPDGSIVVGERTLAIGEESESMAERSSIEEAVLDAPIVVRVELGAVSMSAREWASLRAGDVIETGRRLNEPVVLRVAGREVARGELCEVEGELGVRIKELGSEAT